MRIVFLPLGKALPSGMGRNNISPFIYNRNICGERIEYGIRQSLALSQCLLKEADFIL
jgi:hypothetical protein